jgi:hypothetical protein
LSLFHGIELSRQTLEKTQILNFMKICLMGAELFHSEGKTDGLTDGQTRMTKLIVAFRNLAEAPKMHTKAAQVCRHLTGLV